VIGVWSWIYTVALDLQEKRGFTVQRVWDPESGQLGRNAGRNTCQHQRSNKTYLAPPSPLKVSLGFSSFQKPPLQLVPSCSTVWSRLAVCKPPPLGGVVDSATADLGPCCLCRRSGGSFPDLCTVNQREAPWLPSSNKPGLMGEDLQVTVWIVWPLSPARGGEQSW